MLNLNDPIDRKKLILQIQEDINTFSIQEFSEDPRKHLGASVIGDDCLAKAWNSFRWLKFEQFDGRMYRLFNRGHEEESRFVRWLRGIGFEVREFDPETSKQFRIVGCKGHFGGSLDGMCKAPARYQLNQDLVILNEFKTHNEKSFAKLAGPITSKSPLKRDPSKAIGMIRSKPMHYKQMCSYGRGYSFEWGLYCAVNKETDELYFEVVKLDWLQADDMFRKAESVIFSQTMPAKIAQTESFFDCKYCHFAGICHRGEVPTKNCRSCRHAFPIENGQWFCEVNSPRNDNLPIPDSTIKIGCDSYSRIA